MGGRLRYVWYVLFLLGVILLTTATGYALATPQTKASILLAGCFFSPPNSRAECAFRVIDQKIDEEGIVPALDAFLAARDMFPENLDYDCHSATHRFGDMVYYSMFFTGETEVSKHEFPARSMVCNRAFYHGLFEHMFQDRPEPQFIVDTCNYFKMLPDQAMHEVANSCFHAAGHGLFRYQAERVAVKDYGNVEAFFNNPAQICENLPGLTEPERFVCITGIQSIFIIASLRGEYDFKDPDPNNPYAVCELFEEGYRENCWSVRSIMLGHMDNDYPQALAGCAHASMIFFERCIRGIIIGVFTNGVNPESYSRLVAFCSEEAVAVRDRTEFCYERLAIQLQLEYQEYPVDCNKFPAAYRHYCTTTVGA